MTIIRDGSGSKRQATVNADKRLEVDAVIQSLEHYYNDIKGSGYHIILQQTPTGANDCFFYLKNTGTKSIIIEGFSHRVASAESVEIYLLQTGTPSGGTTNTPVNVNSGSARLLTATVESGNDITGMSGGNLIDRVWMTSTSSSGYNFELDVIVEPGHTLTMYAATGGVQIDMVIYAYEKV